MIETKRCTKCGRELPLSEFYWKYKARGKYQSECKKCHLGMIIETERRKAELSRALKKAEETLGGWKMFYIKHPKQGEYSFNAVSTVGDVFKTNSKAEFLQFVQGL